MPGYVCCLRLTFETPIGHEEHAQRATLPGDDYQPMIERCRTRLRAAATWVALLVPERTIDAGRGVAGHENRDGATSLEAIVQSPRGDDPWSRVRVLCEK